MPDQKNFFWIAASVVNTAAFNSSGNKTIPDYGLCTFLINGKGIFTNGSRSLLKNPLDCTILDRWDFENFILAGEPFAKSLQISVSLLTLCIS